MRLPVLLFAALLVPIVTGACRGPGDAQVDPPVPATHWTPGSWLPRTAAQALAGHRLVLLGEKHGTREIPGAVAVLAQALSEAAPVRLAIEVPRDQQGLLDALLAAESEGDVQRARAALLAEPWWQREPSENDGRRSLDVVDLLLQLRELRVAGRDVAVLAFDVAVDSGLSGDARDAAMAEFLRTASTEPGDGRLLVLTGNVHAMTARPHWAPPQMPLPMGSHLRDLAPLSIDIVATTGEFHACAARPCGPVASSAADDTRRLVGEPWDVRVVLPRFTPARLVQGTHGTETGGS